jgi:multicomponent Na+:H+ antiporter subunit G
MGVLEIFGCLLLVVGCVLALTGSVGVLRMPDFYSRLHPAGKTDTLGQLMMLAGLVLFAGQQILDLFLTEGPDPESAALLGWANIMLKVVLVAALLFVTAPTATHAIAKAARLDRHTDIPVTGDPDLSPPAATKLVEERGYAPQIVSELDVTRRLDEPAHPPVLDQEPPPQEPPR